jgi:predicted Fe-Mo cluster-binding NifX family protein
MKIIIPTDGYKGLEERVADHFGRSATYTLLDENGKIIEIFDNTSQHMGGQGLPPELMKQHGAEILLCHDMGPKAIDLCAKLGIKAYLGQKETVRQLFELWKNKKTTALNESNACQNHRH